MDQRVIPDWLSAKEVAGMLCCAGDGRSTVYRLADEGYLVEWRPTRGRRLFSRESVEEHVRRTRDPEFWGRR